METKNLEPLEPLEDDVETEEVVSIQAVKKPRTQKQIDAFKLVIAKREENRKQRAEQKMKDAEEAKALIETKIVKKAISIKKKEIKRQIILDDVSSDDEPIEEIKQKIVKSRAKAVKPVIPVKTEEIKPKIVFV